MVSLAPCARILQQNKTRRSQSSHNQLFDLKAATAVVDDSKEKSLTKARAGDK